MRPQRPQDPPLLVRSIRRVRKGVYEIGLNHESGRPYIEERVNAPSMDDALNSLRRIYPTAEKRICTSCHKALAVRDHVCNRCHYNKPKVLTGLLTEELLELQLAIAKVDNPGE